MSLTTLVLLWVVYCFLHSFLIATSTTRYLQRVLGSGYRWFRLVYNLFSLAGFIALLIIGSDVKNDPVFEWNGGLKILQYLMFGLGVMLFTAGGWHYDLLEFAGIRQLSKTAPEQPTETRAPVLNRGMHRFIRHPWYTAVFFLIWSSDLNTANLAVNLVLSGYLIIGTLLEERKLVREFGAAYREYQRDVSMFVPLLWLKRSASSRFGLWALWP